MEPRAGKPTPMGGLPRLVGVSWVLEVDEGEPEPDQPRTCWLGWPLGVVFPDITGGVFECVG